MGLGVWDLGFSKRFGASMIFGSILYEQRSRQKKKTSRQEAEWKRPMHKLGDLKLP